MNQKNDWYKKIYLKLLTITAVLLCNTIQAEIPFTWIKALHAVSNREELSIVDGMVWWEQSIMENMYRCDNEFAIYRSAQIFQLLSRTPVINQKLEQTYSIKY